jgi:diguanylate cyclase (GGDEF)-like protein
MADNAVYTVRGLADLGRLLRAIEAGEAAPEIIDALNCEGCIDGPAVSPGLSVYAKRTIDAAARRNLGTTTVSTRALLAVLPPVEVVRSFTPTPLRLTAATPGEIDAELALARLTRESAPDCGACGQSTCVEQAAAVLRGDSTWDLCLPFQRSLVAEQSARLDASETIDGLTGLANRRMFGDRLELELARRARYGTELSLLFADIDGLGMINDTFGEAAGDAVLAIVAARLDALLRSTDLVCRWSADQFGVLLAGIGKTSAFAVGEKLRESIGAAPLAVKTDGYTHEVSVTLSVGVASAGSSATCPGDLLDRADGALRLAMSSGGNQVRLAPG